MGRRDLSILAIMKRHGPRTEGTTLSSCRNSIPLSFRHQGTVSVYYWRYFYEDDENREGHGFSCDGIIFLGMRKGRIMRSCVKVSSADGLLIDGGIEDAGIRSRAMTLYTEALECDAPAKQSDLEFVQSHAHFGIALVSLSIQPHCWIRPFLQQEAQGPGNAEHLRRGTAGFRSNRSLSRS
jgi:hypothetical protein